MKGDVCDNGAPEAIPGAGGRAWPACAAAGRVLWIAVQMLVLQRYFIMQPVIAVTGAIEILLAWLWQRATPAPG